MRLGHTIGSGEPRAVTSGQNSVLLSWSSYKKRTGFADIENFNRPADPHPLDLDQRLTRAPDTFVCPTI